MSTREESTEEPTRSRAHQERQRRYFDQAFARYGTYELENWRISYLQRIFSSLRPNGAQTSYLDIGVGGSGYTIIEAARRGWNSVGIDISAEGVRKAKHLASVELGKENVLCNFVVASAERLPFREGTFEKLTMISVLEHVPRDRHVILEISRILKPSGEFFITVPNSYRRILPVFWLPYIVWDRRVGHLRHYKAENLVREFTKSGFYVQTVSYSAHFYKMIQVLLSSLVPALMGRNSKLWWRIEDLDLHMGRIPSGLQLHLVMRKRGMQDVDART